MGLKMEIGRANIIFSVGKIVSTTIAFFLSIYLARTLQPHEFGLYSFALTIISTAALFTDFGINGILFKFGSEKNYQKDLRSLKRLIDVTFKYKLESLLLVSGSIIIFSGEIASLFGKPQAVEIIILSGIILFSLSIAEYIFNIFTMMRAFKDQSIFRIAEQILKTIFIVVFVMFGYETYGALIGNAIAYMILFSLMGYVVLKKYPWIMHAKPTIIDFEKLRKFRIWTTIGVAVGLVYGSTDKLIISKMLPIESIGFYQVAYTWVFSITYIIPLTPQVMLAYFSNNLSSKIQMTKIMENSIKYTAILSVPFSFILSAFSGAFVILLYGTSYLPAGEVLKIMALMVTPMLFCMFFSNYYVSINKPDVPLKVVAPLAIMLFVLSIVLIPRYGLIGAAYTMLFAKILEMFIYMYLLFFKENLRFHSHILWKPLFASTIVYAILDFALPHVFKEINLNNFIITGIAAFSLYILLMLAIKGITKEDLQHTIALIIALQ